MDPVMIVLRTFHILGGALWFGSAFLFAGFFGPASAETAPSSGPIMSNGRGRLMLNNCEHCTSRAARFWSSFAFGWRSLLFAQH